MEGALESAVVDSDLKCEMGRGLSSQCGRTKRKAWDLQRKVAPVLLLLTLLLRALLLLPIAISNLIPIGGIIVIRRFY